MNPATFQLPYQTVLSNVGAPVSGAQAFFYQSGTTTAQAVYTTSALSVPHTQPVVADSFGRLPPIYLDDSKSYRVIIRDAADNLIYDEDNFNDTLTAAEVGAALYPQSTAENAASTTPTDFTFPPGNAKRYGAVGDGTTDDTAALQAWIDCGETDLTLPAGDYLTSKGAADVANFPNGDEPCLKMLDKAGVVVNFVGNARLLVNEHAQGILELQRCTRIDIHRPVFIGPTDFPGLDGTTGRGEKGTSTDGYDTTTAGIWGQNKNNSLDTSANTGGGFSGAFPQYGGGTAASWGTWNSGFIGNVAYGLLIQNACDNVTVHNGYAEGFNFSGMGVGHPGDSGYAASTNIHFIRPHIKNCYASGLETCGVDGGSVVSPTYEDIGHPDAVPLTDTFADPGYGYTARGDDTLDTKNFYTTNITARRCVRKGWDLHKADGAGVKGGTIEDCGAGAIFAVWTSPTQPVKNINISDLNLIRSGYADNDLGAMRLGGCIDADYSYDNILMNANVSNINFIECGGINQLTMLPSRNVNFDNITFFGVDSRWTTDCYAAWIGRTNATQISYGITVDGMNVDANQDVNLVRGIRCNQLDESTLTDTKVRLDHASASEGTVVSGCLKLDCSGNRVYWGAVAGIPLNLQATDGKCADNWSDATAGSSFPIAYETTSGEQVKAFAPVHIIQLDITFNGTTSPTYTVNSGEDYVASVGELATFGAQVTFQNLQPLARYRATFTQRSADGLEAAAGDITFVYERAISSTALEIGLKTNASGTDIIASNCTGGTLGVTVSVF